MARLDVHPMPGEREGYVLEAERLSHLATCIVLPLLPEVSALKPIATLNPVYEIRGRRHVLPQGIASIVRRALDSAVASLAEDDDSITRALGFLLVGD
ncbi:CcdB family protein [Acidisoma sp. L85]|uniref:CcdB family protein n=1 Tax=Acidisoma sp. L85 TaxID=1641850 RepID=UPI0020B166B3|nr:CcdB family protein [Acidisoma sp. L85]